MMKRWRIFAAAAALLGMTVTQAAALRHIPYTTYTYSVEGQPQTSPHAYIPSRSLSAPAGLETAFAEPTDIVRDKNDRLYIADTGNDRIVILNADLTLCRVIAEFDNAGKADRLSGPRGVYVTGDGTIYVSDTQNERIVYFDAEGRLLGVIDRPESPLFEADYAFKPQTLAVDRVGRLFVVSENMNKGILILDREGNFKSFFGAQKVQYDPLEFFWRRFMTEEQIDRTESFVPSEYNSITIDEDGFLFVTSSSIDATLQYAATVGKDTTDQYAPVKRFGAAGVDVLYRRGGYPPSGDISVSLDRGGPSVIVDCVPGKYGSYTLLDQKRNKLFTYDVEGNLLYAFGGTGSQLGLFEGLCAAVTLSDDRLICLDKTNSELTVFERTEYGTLLSEVMRLHDEHRYSEEAELWKKVLLYNNNLDYAYIGLGSSLIKEGRYREAMELFRTASNTERYSEAFEKYRQELLSDWLLLIPAVVIAVLVGIGLWFSFIRRFNRACTGRTGKRTIGEQLAYAFYTCFHPFDGFWDLHHEGRGSLPAGLILLAAMALTCGLRAVGSGYLYASGASFWTEPLVLLLFVALFVTANFGITSLTDGKGTAAQVLTTTCYALLPLLLMTLPQIALSHVLTLGESSYMTLFSTVGIVWTGAVLFAGVLTTHQYTFGKAAATVLLTLVGMAVIVFLTLMFFNLLEPMITFFVNYCKEILYRL